MAPVAATAVQRWLQTYCDRSDQVAGGVVVVPGTGDRTMQTAAEWPLESALTPPLVAAAKAAVQRARPVVLVPAVTDRDAEHSRVISLPLRAGTRSLGAVALAVRTPDADAARSLLQDLERAAATLATALNSLAAPTQPVNAASLLRFQAALMGREKLAEGAAALAGVLAADLGFDRVSVGVMDGNRIDVLALSNSAEFKRGQDLMRALAAAMEEAADQGVSVAYPAAVSDRPRIVLAHAELVGHTGMPACTVPLVSAARTVGALLFERSGATGPSPQEVELCEHIACMLGPIVELKHRAGRAWTARAAETAGTGWAMFTGRGDPWPKVAFAGLIAAVAAAVMIPVQYRIGAPARLEGAEQRVLVAPIDGYLRRVHARPGDTVRAGDVLVELADQDLALEERKWESDLAQHENGYSAALARADRAQFVVSQAKATEARAQLDLVRQQLARTRLTAPIDGIVIKGDLSQSLGAPVQRGDVLLTIAPSDHYRLIVEVDERDIGDIRAGQTGQLALSGLPMETLAFTVERVTPVAMIKDGRNSFEVEATLEPGNAPLRPGLQGVAKIDAGTHPSPGSGRTASPTGCASLCGRGESELAASLFSEEWYRVARLQPRLRAEVRVRRQGWRDQQWYLLSDDATGRQLRINDAAYEFIGRCDGTRTVQEVWDAVLENRGDDAPTQDEVIQLLGQLNEQELLHPSTRPTPRESFSATTSEAPPARVRSIPSRFACRSVDPAAFLRGSIRWAAALPSRRVLALADRRRIRRARGRGPNRRRSGRTPAAHAHAALRRAHAAVLSADQGAARAGARARGAPLGRRSARNRLQPVRARPGAVRRRVGGLRLSRAATSAPWSAPPASWSNSHSPRSRCGSGSTCSRVSCATSRSSYMFIASVSTLVFNGNPLLRFDAYYVLCDVLDLPNLASRSNAWWTLHPAAFGLRARADAPALARGERKWLLAYAPLSAAYRVAISVVDRAVARRQSAAAGRWSLRISSSACCCSRW